MHRGVLLGHFPLASLLNPDPTATITAVLLLLLLMASTTPMQTSECRLLSEGCLK
jgi:hypothetical protein